MSGRIEKLAGAAFAVCGAESVNAFLHAQASWGKAAYWLVIAIVLASIQLWKEA